MVATNNEVLKGSPNERLLTPSQIHKEYPEIEIEAGILEDAKLKNIKIPESEIKIRSILGITKEYLQDKAFEQLQTNTQKPNTVKKDIEKGNKINDIGGKDLKKEGILAEHEINKELEKIDAPKEKKLEIRDALEKTQAGLGKAGGVIKQSGVIEKSEGALKNMGNTLEKLPIIGPLLAFLINLFKNGIAWLKNIFKIGEKLSPEEIANTKKEIAEKIRHDILGKFPKMHPLLKQKLQEKIENSQNINDENIIALKKIKDEKGELELKDIKSILGNNEYSEIVAEMKKDPSLKDALKVQFETTVLNKLSKEYGINLLGDKKAQLHALIQEQGGVHDERIIEYVTKIQNGEVITMNDLIISFFGEGMSATTFVLKLTAKGIISLDSIALNIVESGAKMVKISVGLLGNSFQSHETGEFEKMMQNMDKKEKIFFLGMLYRKGGALFDVLGNMSAFVSRQLIELSTPSKVGDIEILKTAMPFASIDRKIQTFEELEKILGGNEGSILLKTSREEMSRMIENNKIIACVEKVEKMAISEEQRVKHLSQLLEENHISSTKIQHIQKFEDARNVLSKRVSTPTYTVSQKIKAYFHKGIRAREIEFNRNVEGMLSYQSKRISGVNSILRSGSKLKESLNILQIGKNTERLLLESKTVEGTITKIEALKRVALEAPELIKGLLGVVPEITILSLAAWGKKENESILKAWMDIAPYLTRIVGPCKMLLSLGGAYKDGKVQWYNVVEGGLGGVFLGIDTAVALKILGENGFSGRAGIEIGKFILKPFTSPINVLVKTGQFGKTILDVKKAGGTWGELGQSVKQSLKEIKLKPNNILKTKNLILISAVIGGGWVMKEILDTDADEYMEILLKNGYIDNKGNLLDEKIKSAFASIQNEEKIILCEMLFEQLSGYPLIAGGNSRNKVEFKIENTQLSVMSHSTDAPETIVTPEIQEQLERWGISHIIYINDASQTRFEKQIL